MNAESAIPVTAIILTLDEETNIPQCLNCLRDVGEVVIVDSFSSDDTVDAAHEARPDARIYQNQFQDFGAQRNWALANTNPEHEWVLFVDADEFCDERLLSEIDELVRHPGDCVGAYIAGRNYLMGRWLKRATMYPFYQFRLLKRGAASFVKSGHGQREVVEGNTIYLENSWRHESFSKGIAEWIRRHNVYSSEEARLMLVLRQEEIAWRDLFARDPVKRRRQLKRLSASAPLRPLLRFLYLYLYKRGFMDGYPGLVFCLLVLANQIHISAKIAELRYRERQQGT